VIVLDKDHVIKADSTIAADAQGTARFLAKADGVVAGLHVVDLVFQAVDPKLEVKWTVKDGDRVSTGLHFGSVTGSARSLLVAERLALNILQRTSGIATATRAMVDAVGKHPAKILDTRKTAPGLRILDKMAHRIGGGVNHRIGLYDMVLIKDNHIEAAGGITNAVKRVKSFLKEKKKENLEIEVEARTLEEVKEVLAVYTELGGGNAITRVLLDNMVSIEADGTVNTSVLQKALQILQHKIPSEASGNVTILTAPAIAATGVEYISSGALTHSVTALDISLKIKC